MNLIRCNFVSDVLHTPVNVTVCLPKRMKTPLDPPDYKPKDIFPVLYLLHGAMDYGDSWLYNTELAQRVDETEIAVVMPSVGNSFYLDEPAGLQIHTFVTEELPDYLGRIFPFSQKPEETFIGGLSMGGYGSLYAALEKPGKYGKVFSLSGALDIRRTSSFVNQCGASLPSHLRDRKALPGSRYDLFARIETMEEVNLPPLYLACGTEDFFIRDNRQMALLLEAKGADFTLTEAPGDHEWSFWSKHLNEAFAFLTKA